MNRKQALGFAVGPIGAGLLSFLTLPVIAWIFPPSAVGKLSMLQVAISLSTLIFSFGLDQSYGREYHESKDRPKLLLNSALPSLTVIVFCMTILGIFFPTALSSALFGERSTLYGFIVSICLIIALIGRFLSLMLRMQDRGLAYSMSQILSNLLLLFIVVFYLFFYKERNFLMILAAQAMALLLTVLAFLWNTRNDWVPATRCKFDANFFVKLLRFGWPLIIAGCAMWGLATLNRVFLRAMSTYEELAVYSVTMSLAAAVTVAASIFDTIWTPMVYRWVAEKSDLGRIDSVADSMALIFLLLICAAGGGAWILQLILPDAYSGATYIVVGCVAGRLLYTMSEVTGVGITVSRKTLFSVMSAGAAVVVNCFLSYLLIPEYGASGAMLATLSSYYVFFVTKTELSIVCWRKLHRIKNYIKLLFIN